VIKQVEEGVSEAKLVLK